MQLRWRGQQGAATGCENRLSTVREEMLELDTGRWRRMQFSFVGGKDLSPARALLGSEVRVWFHHFLQCTRIAGARETASAIFCARVRDREEAAGPGRKPLRACPLCGVELPEGRQKTVS